MLEAIAPFIIGIAIAQEVIIYAMSRIIRNQDDAFHDLYEIAEKRYKIIEQTMMDKDFAEDKAIWYIDFTHRVINDVTDSFNIVPHERSKFIQHRMNLRNKELLDYEAGRNDDEEETERENQST